MYTRVDTTAAVMFAIATASNTITMADRDDVLIATTTKLTDNRIVLPTIAIFITIVMSTPSTAIVMTMVIAI